MKKQSKTFKKWAARATDTKTPWSETDIIYFRKALGRSGFKDASDRSALLAMFREKAQYLRFRITPEQDQKGKNYLLENTLKKDGTLRKGAVLDMNHVKTLQNLKHHLFVGLRDQGNMYFNSYVAVYRAVGKDGSWFEYTGCRYDMIEVLDDSADAYSGLQLVWVKA